MARSPSSPTLVRRFSPTEADLALKAEQQARYVKDLWILLSCVVAILTLIRVLRSILSFSWSTRHAEKPCSEKTTDVEAVQSGLNGRISLRRLPTALTSAFRIVAFRLNIPVGPGSVASVAELVFILGYIVVMLVLMLINSQCRTSFRTLNALTLYTAEDLQSWFYEDRAAHLASCQLPLIVALAGKNNIISCKWLHLRRRSNIPHNL